MKYNFKGHIKSLVYYEEVAWLFFSVFRSDYNLDLHSYGQLLSLFFFIKPR